MDELATRSENAITAARGCLKEVEADRARASEALDRAEANLASSAAVLRAAAGEERAKPTVAHELKGLEGLEWLGESKLYLLEYKPLPHTDGTMRLMVVRKDPGNAGFRGVGQIDYPIKNIHQTFWPTPHNVDWMFELSLPREDFPKLGNYWAYAVRLHRAMGIVGPLRSMQEALQAYDPDGVKGPLVRVEAQRALDSDKQDAGANAAWLQATLRSHIAKFAEAEKLLAEELRAEKELAGDPGPKIEELIEP